MDCKAKNRWKFGLPALIFGMLSLAACENSLNDIAKITSKEEDKPITISKSVDIIYSDSAKVRARMLTPLMIELDDPKKPYQEFPKGVKIIFFDDSLKEKGTITSEYALRLMNDNITTFKKNVVATNAQGETFKSDELIYDENTKKIYTDKPVQIDMGNGNMMYGIGASSNESLFPWHIEHSTGTFHVDEKGVQ